MGTGNPRGQKGHGQITEGHYPELYGLWLRGNSVHSIAARFNVNWHTANHHLQKCRLALRNLMLRDRSEVLDEVTAVRQAAWEAFGKSKRSLTHDEVQKEVDAVAIEKGISPEVAGQVVKQTVKLTMRDGNPNWLTVVLAAIDTEAKLSGHYETGKREGQKPVSKGAYRAAGRKPKEITDAMADRMHKILSERREALVGGSN